MDELRRLQEKRSFQAMRDARFGPHQDGGLRISLKAYGAFFPAAFDGLRVGIRLGEPGSGKEIAGRLGLLPASAPRGAWFDYVFIADDTASLAEIVFIGLNQWSNIHSVVFRGAYPKWVRNPFFRAASP